MKRLSRKYKDALAVISEDKKIIFVGTLVPLLTAALLTLFMPNLYRAGAVIYIDNPKATTTIQPVQNQLKTEIFDYSISNKAITAILTSDELLDGIRKSLKLEKISIGNLKGMLVVENPVEFKTYSSVELSPFFNLKVTVKKDQKLAVDIANKWAYLFTEKFDQMFNRRNWESHQYILSQTRAAESILKDAQKALLSFEASTGRKRSSWQYDFEQGNLQRAVESAKISYDFFQAKLAEAKSSLEEQKQRVIICSKAVEPPATIGPPRILIVFLAALLGFVSSIFFSLFQNYFKIDN